MKEAEEERQREEERLYNEWKKTFEIVEQGEDGKSSEEKKRIHDEIVQEIENEKMMSTFFIINLDIFINI